MSTMTGLLRAGLALKTDQIKLAAGSYLRDRTHQATVAATSYAMAAGLYAAAAVFLFAACLVGAAALFRWVEIKYGLFWAFGATGSLLIALAAICLVWAAIRLNRTAADFPSLTSRLRVAVRANPLAATSGDSAHNTTVSMSKPSALTDRPRERTASRPTLDDRGMQAGLAVTAMLLGWAVVRRQRQARRGNA